MDVTTLLFGFCYYFASAAITQVDPDSLIWVPVDVVVETTIASGLSYFFSSVTADADAKRPKVKAGNPRFSFVNKHRS